ncbi:hypothetical protein EVAR_18428_1 [Eumeta japonica]|uniref:Uncharacterized protein n=1 Tax=Eumeta variegata TaxID=151549 RepID=A0A4C1UU30_EUMVA|nr:hypothetical protein EVAR_18428_1 [Eumeta japonica]
MKQDHVNVVSFMEVCGFYLPPFQKIGVDPRSDQSHEPRWLAGDPGRSHDPAVDVQWLKTNESQCSVYIEACVIKPCVFLSYLCGDTDGLQSDHKSIERSCTQPVDSRATQRVNLREVTGDGTVTGEIDYRKISYTTQVYRRYSIGRVRALSLFYSDASADGEEERSLVPRSRLRARLRRNATMSHAFSCVQPVFIDL